MILTLYSFINFKFLFVYLNTKDMETGWLKEIQRHTGNVSGVCCLKQIKRKRDLFFTLLFTLFFWFTFLQLVQRGEFTSRWHHSPFMHTPPFTSAWWQICRKTWRNSNSLHQSEKRANLSFCCYLKFIVLIKSQWRVLIDHFFVNNILVNT